MSANGEKHLTTRLLVDTILLICVAVFVPLFYVNIFTPVQRGFFCDDDTIRYPYHDSTVTDGMLYGIGITAGIILIVIAQVQDIFQHKSESHHEQTPQLCLFGHSIPQPFWKAYSDSCIFLFGVCVTDLCTNVTKYFVGRLRPNFIDVCKPDVDCGLPAARLHEYVEAYNCTNTDVEAVVESRLSFPSGHSSIAAYAMVFCSLYIHRKIRISQSHLALPVLQTFLLMLAVCTAASRLYDNKHHWSDIMVGLSIGTAFAFFCGYRIPADERDADRKVHEKQNLELS